MRVTPASMEPDHRSTIRSMTISKVSPSLRGLRRLKRRYLKKIQEHIWIVIFYWTFNKKKMTSNALIKYSNGACVGVSSTRWGISHHWPVGDDDGVVELSEGVGAGGGDAVVADPRVAAVEVVEAQLVGVVQQYLRKGESRFRTTLFKELPDVMSAKCSDFLTPSPLSAFGSDSFYKIHSNPLTTPAFPWPPSDADIISGGSHIH